MRELTNHEFEKYLKHYGAKTMLSFDINEIIKYNKNQKKKLKECENEKERNIKEKKEIIRRNY